MTRHFILLLTIALLGFNKSFAQTPKKWTSTNIQEAMQKLDFLGAVLYFAAHPDDENTRMISYLSNVRHAETAYLSLTRGDGGQNLIGSEIREQLGVIRTQELLAARRIDGGKQFFSRANDFSFSKHPDETFNIWGKDAVMEDAVWVIRNFRPDVIINRFDHRTPGSTHGHHTASAIISVESFNKSGNPHFYPKQLEYVDTWKPQRIFFNTNWWFYGSRENFEKADKSKLIKVDVGAYLPKRGESSTEIAARSRSQHKSQGMGTKYTRGGMDEYLELVAGEMPENADDLFSGINTTWTRLKGGAKIGQAIDQLLADFNFDQPQNSLHQLMLIRKMILNLEDGYWKKVKLKEVEDIIEGCLGLFLEVTASDKSATPGQVVNLSFEAINRSNTGIRLENIHFIGLEKDTMIGAELDYNKGVKWTMVVQLPKDMPLTNAYWLNEKASLGLYTVKNQSLRGQAISPVALKARFDLVFTNDKILDGEKLSLEKEIAYNSIDPVMGERYSPFEITPPVFVQLDEQVYIFANTAPKELTVTVDAGQKDLIGKVRLEHPDNWKVEPDFYDFSLKQKGQEANFKFTVFPPDNQHEAIFKPVVELGDQSYSRRLNKIEYSHIPTQTVFLDAAAKAVRLQIKKKGQYIGYLMGAGDDVPQALEQIGYHVTLLTDRDMHLERLKSFDAVIIGVRAYNTLDRMPIYQPHLMQYVQEGGTLIVQFNTKHRLKVPSEEIAPYPLTISRDRVTVEEAEVTIIAPKHTVMNTPNKITSADFEGWVQERGLYFPNEWDEAFTPILSCHDVGEPDRKGGLLIAKYGDGYYVYTGYSWFRELPAGVAGAYRIFANMISLGNGEKP